MHCDNLQYSWYSYNRIGFLKRNDISPFTYGGVCKTHAVAAPPLYALHAIGLSFFIRVRLQNQYCQVNNAMQLSYLFAISLDIFTFIILAFLPKS